MTVTSLLVKGDFAEQDIAELMKVFRTIEQRRPTEPFMVAILESDLSMREGQNLIRRTFPRLDGEEPTFQTIAALQVVCPDGQTRKMIPDIGNLAPDIDQPELVMAQGSVDIDGRSIHGEAWRRDGSYHFMPFKAK